MSTISVGLPSDGQTIDAADYNVPINTIVTLVNGNIDTNNISPTAGITAAQLNFGGAGSGIWWQEIGRTTLSGAGDTISVTSIPARKYLKIQVFVVNSGQVTLVMRFNNDSAANYAQRYSSDGAAHTTGGSSTQFDLFSVSQTFPFFAEFEVINFQSTEKQVTGVVVGQNTAGAANVPGSREHFSKWANTAAQINRVDILNTGSGDFAIGSELVILGHD